MSTTRTLLPGCSLGLLGGGQLGRMFAQAAATMGYHVTVLDPSVPSPAGEVSRDLLTGAYTDPDLLKAMKDQVVAALRMNGIVENMIPSIQKAITTAANDSHNSSDLLELSLELLNRIALINKQLFPSSITLFLLGLQHLHSMSNRLNQECYYDLSEPLKEADCVNNWLLLLNSFVEGQSQRISMQCASFVIQYMPSILKVLISLVFF